MKKVVLKKDYSIKVDPKVTNFISPDTIHMIIKPSYKIQINNNLKIYKEQLLFKDNDKPIYSYVSGDIIAHEEVRDSLNNKYKSIVIKNDYKEQFLKEKKLIINTKEELIRFLIDKGITCYNNSNILLLDIIKKIKSDSILVINAIDDEPYFANKSMIVKNYLDEILETLDKLSKMLKLKRIYLLLKNTQTDTINEVITKVGSYLNISIKLLPDYYGYGNNLILKDNAKIKNINFINIGDTIILHNMINKGKITTKKYITISGNLVKKPKVINVKLGVKLKDVLDKNIKYDKKGIFIVNGLMTGKHFDNIESLIITNDFDGLIITEDREYEEEQCINCGLCYKICPLNINPLKGDSNKCCHCNLCNYICPAHLKIKENNYDK